MYEPYAKSILYTWRKRFNSGNIRIESPTSGFSIWQRNELYSEPVMNFAKIEDVKKSFNQMCRNVKHLLQEEIINDYFPTLKNLNRDQENEEPCYINKILNVAILMSAVLEEDN